MRFYHFMGAAVFLSALALADSKKAKIKAPIPNLPSSKQGVILNKIQEVWAKTQTFQADFKQSLVSKLISPEPDVTQGKIFVKKPGKLRWETPGLFQVLNSPKLIIVQEKKKRKSRTVDIYMNARKTVDASVLDFLVSSGKLLDAYQVNLTGDREGFWELRMVTKKGITFPLVAEIDKNSYQLRALASENEESKIRVEFTRVQTNTPVDDSLFEYKPEPRDTVHENP